MIAIKVKNKKFKKDMNNLMGYSVGFLVGAKRGQGVFLKGFGATVVEALKRYIDSSARVSPQLLHHVYEWNQVGSPNARLFDISYVVNGVGLSINSKFKQSTSIKDGSRVPFYDKARIMEEGIPVTIVPKGRVLAFQVDGDDVFTTQPVRVNNPGGNVEDQYEKVFDNFFSMYFTQAFLSSTGILAYLKNPLDFSRNLSKGKVGGYSTGVSVGNQWMAKAGII
jgi:hypothetical protein